MSDKAENDVEVSLSDEEMPLEENGDQSAKENEEQAKENEEQAKENEQPAKENEEPLAKKKALLRPVVTSLKERVDHLVDMTKPEHDDKDYDSRICFEAKKIRQLADELTALAITTEEEVNVATTPKQYQHIVKVKGLTQQIFRDVRNLLQNDFGFGMVKFSPAARNSDFLEINFSTEQAMEKAMEIICGESMAANLSVIEKKKVAKDSLPSEVSVDDVDSQFDPIVKLKESLHRSKELTDEEYKKMVEWKEKYIEHVLKKVCKKIDSEIQFVMKNSSEGLLFKLEKMNSSSIRASLSERYQSYSGLNPDTGKVEMGYWVLGSDVPSRIPRTENVQKTLMVMTDIMESSDKPFFDMRVQKGFWESLIIRSNHLGQCMVVMVVRAGGDKEVEKNCESVKQQLSELMETQPGKECNIKSVQLRIIDGFAKPGAGKMLLLYGDESLEEEVSGVKLLLRPGMMFDGGCSETMMEAVTDELGLGRKDGVLVVGVGSEVVPVYLAKRCKVVCCFDRMANMIDSAQKSLDLNELKNVTMARGMAANKIRQLFENNFKDCDELYVVIMESTANPRSREELITLRKFTRITRAVYMVFSWKDLSPVFKLLCSKHADNVDPFVITKVIPIDVPSNARPNLLLVLERSSTLKGRVEKRVFEPPAKKAKLSHDGPIGGQQPRAGPTGKKFGRNSPPRRFPFSGGRGASRNQAQRPGFVPRRPAMPAWTPNARSPQASQFSPGQAASRFRMEEEEAMLRARRDKEIQLQQMQEMVLEAQRRQLVTALTPSPPVQNIEEVVLSAIKKTGLMERVAALSDALPTTPRSESTPRRSTDDWDRYNDLSLGQRWVQRSIGAGSNRGGTPSGYQGRGPSTRYRDM